VEEFNNNRFENEGATLRDYFNLIIQYIVPISIITFAGLTVAIIYALTARNIYESTTTLKIEKPTGSILEAPLMPEFSDFGNDRFIANEIEVLKSYTIREKVAKKLYEQFYQINEPDSFYLIINREFFDTDTGSILKTIFKLTELFDKKVSIEQKRGLDIVEISVQSPAAFEAALIANDYADAYREINLAYNRQQLVAVRKFLEKQRELMLQKLAQSENALKVYQEKNGIIELSEQARALIAQITDLQAKVNEAKLNYMIAQKSVETLKEQLAQQDPKLKGYLENFAVEAYIQGLQEQIARLEVQKDIALSQNINDPNLQKTIAEYDQKIAELKAKLNRKIEVYKASIFASSPEEVKALTQKLIEEEINAQAYKASYNELAKILDDYEKNFNSLPTRAIDLARLERERLANEKLYLLIEEKYQEAQINEQATPGNVIIIDKARRAHKPAKPNRILIVLIGLILGGGFGLGYAFVRNYFDNTVKTPEDIQKHRINVLAWIPEIEGLDAENKEFEFIVAKKPDSIPSEAYRALRTRILFSKLKKTQIKTILVTSSAPREGKTTVSVNLAGTFAISGKKTVIVDLDLRKPRTHHLFGYQKTPGVTDYLFGDKAYEEIVKTTNVNNLFVITAGTIPPNPAEVLASEQMAAFLDKLNEDFDFVVIDSPPIVAVTDAEILSRIVDATLLVVSANITEIDLMTKAVELLSQDNDSFIGVVLNRFSYRSGYGSYYKYYYYYSRPDLSKKNNKQLKS
jgi:tyrosine-protein kinase Etk/Wzc